jgi:adenosylcobinamide-GDP ribazoletransferase
MRKVPSAFLAAVGFLTRVPVPGRQALPSAVASLLQEAAVFFPLVGGLIGLFTGAVIWAGSFLWPMPLAVLIGLAAEAVLTGAFHEDAVADCCDGFGGGWSREDVLRIMKDSRIGSFGMLGLALALLIRGSCLAVVDRAELLPVAAASSGLGRWAGLVMMALVPPLVDREGLARDVGGRIRLRDLIAGTLLAAPAVVWYAWLEPSRFGGGQVAVLLGVGAWAWYVRRRLGGTTGDCLGFACYLGQVLVLLAAAAQPVSLAAN